MSEDKFYAILSAARDLFAERGFDEVTVQEIAQRAEVAAGTVIYYFKSKKNLLFILARTFLHDRYEALRAAISPEPGPALASFVTAFFDYYRGHHTDFLVCIKADPFLLLDTGAFPAADLLLIKEQHLALLGRIIEQGQASGVFREAPPREAALVVLSLLEGAVRQMCADPNQPSLSCEAMHFVSRRFLKAEVCA